MSWMIELGHNELECKGGAWRIGIQLGHWIKKIKKKNKKQGLWPTRQNSGGNERTIGSMKR